MGIKFCDDKAFSQGYVAGEAGVPVANLPQVNPYNSKSEKFLYDSWLEGYWEGHNDYLFELQTDRYSNRREDIVFMLLTIIAIMVCAVGVYKGVQYFFG